MTSEEQDESPHTLDDAAENALLAVLLTMAVAVAVALALLDAMYIVVLLSDDHMAPPNTADDDERPHTLDAAPA